MPRIDTFGQQPGYDALRRERYTIALAARTINVIENDLRAALKGNASPSPDVRHRLRELLGCRLTELFTPEALGSAYKASKNVWKPVAE